MVGLLLICLWGFCVCLCFWYALLCVLSCFAIILKRKRELVALLYVLRMSCYCICSVALPYGVVGWSAVCDYGISWSYSLNLLFILLHTFKNTHSYTLYIHVFYSRLQTHFNKVRKVWCFFLNRELTSTNGINYSFWTQFPFTCENAVIFVQYRFLVWRFYYVTPSYADAV